MRKLFQKEWQDIKFSTFTETSSGELADASFYNAFYRALFERYTEYGDLNAEWRLSKEEVADWLADRSSDGKTIMSIGCGLGYMEQYLWKRHGNRLNLHVQDYASEAHRWLREVLPAERIHSPDHKVGQESYDLIYLSAVDYAMDDKALVELLTNARRWLRPHGEVFVISASFLDDGLGQSVSHWIKEAAKCVLEALGLYRRGQLWGWMRSRQEYSDIMRRAGYPSIEDGFIETPLQKSYWIKGCLEAPGEKKAALRN